MEEMLSKFQNDLGSISSEIQILQDQSHSMSIKLKNRQVHVREEVWCACVGGQLYIVAFAPPPLYFLLPSLLFSSSLLLSPSLPFFPFLGSKRGAQPVCLRDYSHRAPHPVRCTHLLTQLRTKHYHPSSSSRHITDTPASEREFLENLHELDHKIKFLNLQDFNDCRAVYDVHDVVDKLKLRAVAKTREFLLQKVYQFRKPMANYQMLQNQLLNYRSPPPPLHPPLSLSA